MKHCQHCEAQFQDPKAMLDCIETIQHRINRMAAERQGPFEEETLDAMAEVLCALRILYNERPALRGE